MDFRYHRLLDGRRLRVLTVFDQDAREALATAVRRSFFAHSVIGLLNWLPTSHRESSAIQLDNGSESALRALDTWVNREDAGFDFGRPGKPMHDVHVESFSARLRAESPNAHVCESLEDA